MCKLQSAWDARVHSLHDHNVSKRLCLPAPSQKCAMSPRAGAMYQNDCPSMHRLLLRLLLLLLIDGKDDLVCFGWHVSGIGTDPSRNVGNIEQQWAGCLHFMHLYCTTYWCNGAKWLCYSNDNMTTNSEKRCKHWTRLKNTTARQQQANFRPCL